jgi:hypothetical protein
MARRENSDFLGRLFDEPAGGKSPKSHPGKRSRRPDSRAHILAVLEAAGERLDEGVVLDDALLAAYLDGALAGEEQVALEGLLARSADLRDQLAAAGEARVAVLGGRARMPKTFIEDFDAVPAPAPGKPAPSPKAARTGALPRWLASLAPGRRWAVAALPAILAVVVVAVIGPAVYGPEEARTPETAVRGMPADKDVKGKSTAGKRRSKVVGKEKSPRAGAAAGLLGERPRGGSSGAGQRRRLESRDRLVARVEVALDSDLRAAIITMGLRQTGALSAAGGRARAKQEAAKRPAAKAVAPKPAPKLAEERERRAAKAKPDEKKSLRSYSAARKRVLRKQPPAARKAVEKAIDKNCPGGVPTCCERRRVDPKLLRRLLAGGPPLQKMTVLHLSSKTCLLTLPGAETGK